MPARDRLLKRKIKGRVETLPCCDPTKQSHEIKTNCYYRPITGHIGAALHEFGMLRGQLFYLKNLIPFTTHCYYQAHLSAGVNLILMRSVLLIKQLIGHFVLNGIKIYFFAMYLLFPK